MHCNIRKCILWHEYRVMTQINLSIHSLGPVVQSTVSFTSSLVVKMLTVLVSTISNSLVFLLKKYEELLHFFSKNISLYVIFTDQIFNNMLTNDIISFDNWALTSTFAVHLRRSHGFLAIHTASRKKLCRCLCRCESALGVHIIKTVFTILSSHLLENEGERKEWIDEKKIPTPYNNDDDDDFKLNYVSTHEGQLHRNGILIW